MSDNGLLVERTGDVLYVTLNRAEKHNPLSRPILHTLTKVFREAHDDALACAVITGAGSKYFAAGGDLRDLSEVREERDVRAMALEGRAALDAIRHCPVPVIAVLNGDAIGGGAELAVACDMRVMSETAHIGYIHGRLSITSAWGGGPDLAALVGPARALHMSSRCELVPASTALAWGLADAVAPADALKQTVEDFVAPLLKQSRVALRGFKALSAGARRGLPYEERREIEHDVFVETWMHEDHWRAADKILSRKG